MGRFEVIGRAAGRVKSFFGFIVGGLFGRLAWSPPGWLRLVGRGLSSLGRAMGRHKAASVVCVSLLAMALGGGGYGWHWWKTRPRPAEVAVSIVAPSLTTIDDVLRPNAAVLEFDGSAAPLSLIGKAAGAGLELVPKIEGAWKWESDRRLAFTPRADWPIGQAFTVEIAKKGVVAPRVLLSTYELAFHTAPFDASIAKTEFYQDPTDANVKKVVASFSFSHAVDPKSFEARLHFVVEPRASSADRARHPVSFHVSYDKLRANAYVHSEPLPVPEQDTPFTVTLDKGTTSARGGPPFDKELTQRLTLPGLYNFLTVESAALRIVDNERGEPEQVVLIETSTGVKESEMKAGVLAYVLPLKHPDPLAPDENAGQKKADDRPFNWQGAASEIGPDTLAASQPLPLEQIASEREYSTLHSFRVHAEPGRFLYILVKKGLHGFGGYVLGNGYDSIEEVPRFPPQLRISQSGSLLSLSGERKVSIVARDIPGVKLTLARVLPDQLHTLVGLIDGRLSQPSFATYRFNEMNVSELFHEERTLPNIEPGKPQYVALDLSKYLEGSGEKRRGLFILTAESFDPARKVTTGTQDRRLILVTDLGLLVKDAADGTHDVFVQSIHGGGPVAGAEVQVLGRNGLPLTSAVTDADGHARIGTFADYKFEKSPTLYLVTRAGDSSFLPIGRGDRELDVSRFDVSGVTDRGAQKGLSAYLFSDRGIYRPGDEIRVGLIVKPVDWQQDTAGVPLQVVVTDARGLTVRKQTIKLGADGFEEIKHQTLPTSPTGTYTFNVYVVKDGQPGGLLGSTTVRVREFLPDRLKIAVRLATENPDGWVLPKGLVGRVSLRNLFGTAAAGHVVSADINLSPVFPAFPKYRDYRFFDPLRAQAGVDDHLGDVKTDDHGDAELDLHLERFAAATYRLTLTAQGFEAEGGRSVAGETSALISPLPFLVGYKPDGDLHFVSRGAKRSVELIAIGPTGSKVAAEGLRAVLVERKYVSVLTRKDDGTYQYSSVKKEAVISDAPLTINEKGKKQPLPTDKPGDFTLCVRDGGAHDAADPDLQRIDFTVAGKADLSRSLEKSSQLSVVLKKLDVAPGEDIELQIKAPYTGAGLITIERDKVYAYRWFKSDTTATRETIRLPDDFEGSGYVSVSFIRDPASDEVYTSPLSFGVVPFSVSRERRTVKVSLTAPAIARPGEACVVKYKTDRPTRVVVFAVDEGILRVAHYEAPDPLGYFFQKRALQVSTSQILDLILPEFSRLVAMSAPGGDGSGAIAANLNPFKRRQDKPVAFWSGIVDADEGERELTFPLPGFFNGTLRVLAVAVAKDALGVGDTRALVRGDFVLSPNVPSVVAPGDEFEVTVSVANNIAGSGSAAEVALELSTSKQLEIMSPEKVKLQIGEEKEATATFRLKATSTLGSGSLRFVASSGGHTTRYATDLSVRPAAPFTTTFQAGHLEDGSHEVSIPRALSPEFRALHAGISRLPLGLAHGLAGYLEKFPHGCTEQIVSQAIPSAVLGKRPEFGFTQQSADAGVSSVIEALRARQNDDGGFGLWAANPHVSPFASVYALHFLVEAKERGFAVPPDLLKSGMDYLHGLVRTEGDDLVGERLRAYAIYVMTRNGMVTANFAAALEKRLSVAHADTFRHDLAAAYLAATYRLLHQEKQASALIADARFGDTIAADYEGYYDGLIHDAQLLYLLAKHFPERAQQLTAREINALANPIYDGRYNTLSSAYAILGLEAYGQTAAANGTPPTVTELLADGKERALVLPDGLLPRVDFSGDAQKIRFSSPGAFTSYWMVSEAGYDTTLPNKAIAQKIEVYREYTGADGKAASKVKLGEELQVHVQLRALGKTSISSIALVDLLPGGFEVVVQPQTTATAPEPGPSDERDNDRSPRGDDGESENEGDSAEGEGGGGSGGEASGNGGGDDNAAPFALPIALAASTFHPEYGDVREDRVVLYGTASPEAQQFVYAIKATNTGSYTVPPILGDSLYDRTVLARGVASKIQVEKR